MSPRLLASAVLTSSLLFLATSGLTQVTSDFSSGADGWTTFGNGGIAVTYHSTGGNPGGHISTVDQTSDWAYLRAPAKFLAPAPYGGEFSFDLRIFNSNPGQYPNIYNVRAALVGGGLTLINESTLPGTAFQHYTFSLTETAGWRIFSSLSQNYNPANPAPTQAQMQNVLANLSGVFIAADYSDGTFVDNGATDQAFVDNVAIVPEPASALLVLVGAAMIALKLRHRRT